VSAINQDTEFHPPGLPRSTRASSAARVVLPAIQHVIHQHDVLPSTETAEPDLRITGVDVDAREVVAIKT